jgi:hypothetical protein
MRVVVSDIEIFLDNEDRSLIFLNITYLFKLGIKLIILFDVQAEYFLKALFAPLGEFFHLVFAELIILQYHSNNVLELLLPLDIVEGVLCDCGNRNAALLECPIDQ